MHDIYGEGGLRVRAHCGVNGARHFRPHLCLGHVKILVHYLDVHVKVGGAYGDPRRPFEL